MQGSKRETRYKEENTGVCGRRQGWDDMRE